MEKIGKEFFSLHLKKYEAAGTYYNVIIFMLLYRLHLTHSLVSPNKQKR
uniref:Uncharacterized protein n=1 Tax=Arundo donax TaxID=35708 RepID=A0A0A9A1T4_ARUDO